MFENLIPHFQTLRSAIENRLDTIVYSLRCIEEAVRESSIEPDPSDRYIRISKSLNNSNGQSVTLNPPAGEIYVLNYLQVSASSGGTFTGNVTLRIAGMPVYVYGSSSSQTVISSPLVLMYGEQVTVDSDGDAVLFIQAERKIVPSSPSRFKQGRANNTITNTSTHGRD